VAAEGLDILDFYRDPATRALYKDHMSHMANRVNVFTGVKYRGVGVRTFEAPAAHIAFTGVNHHGYGVDRVRAWRM
jgi:hypothetical protein